MKKLFLIVLGLSVMSQFEALESAARKRHKNFQQLVESMNEVANSMFDESWAVFDHLDRNFLPDEADDESNVVGLKKPAKNNYATSFSLNNLHGSQVSEKGIFQLPFPQSESSIKPQGEVAKQEVTNQTLLDQNGAKVYKLYELCESAENYKKTVTITAKKNGFGRNQMMIETVTNFEHQQQGVSFGNSSQSSCRSLFVPDAFEPEVASVKIVDGGIEVELVKKAQVIEVVKPELEKNAANTKALLQVCPHCHKSLASGQNQASDDSDKE